MASIIMNDWVLLFLLCCLFSFGASAQSDADCRRYRKGHFKLENPDGSPHLIRRTRARQYEFDTHTGQRAVTSIKWLSPCDYELRYHPPADSSRAISTSPIPLQISIVRVTDGGYVFRASSFDGMLEVEGFLVKIRRREYRRLRTR